MSQSTTFKASQPSYICHDTDNLREGRKVSDNRDNIDYTKLVDKMSKVAQFPKSQPIATGTFDYEMHNETNEFDASRAKKLETRRDTNYARVTLLLSAIAAYPIVNLVMSLIAGAALTLSPANIVLLAAFALFVLITIAYLIKNRSEIKEVSKIALRNLAIFATAPLSLPILLIKKAVVAIKAKFPQKKATIEQPFQDRQHKTHRRAMHIDYRK